MVHFKRKPVRFVSPPPNLQSSVEVWGIEETGEVFTDYESYLERRDYYDSKRFTCDVTGHSGLTYWQALQSERHGSLNLQGNFPEPLREPVLRRVQFSQILRLDDLVNEMHHYFKRDFFPGEHVIAITDQDQRLEGIVREKVSFPAHVQDGVEIRPAMSNYIVLLRQGVDDNGDTVSSEAFFDDKHMTRDRKVFSKLLLRAFLKHSITREPNPGAFWLVKPEIANEYKISTDVPQHLQPHLVPLPEQKKKKHLALARKGARQQHCLFEPGAPDPNAPPHASRGDGKGRAGKAQMQMQYVHGVPCVPYEAGLGPLAPDGHLGAHPGDRPLYANGPPPGLDSRAWHTMPPEPLPKPAPPAIKYPIEDLEVSPRKNGIQRPPLKFLARPRCHAEKGKAKRPSGDAAYSDSSGAADDEVQPLRMESVGPLLEVWNTLNVHEQVFVLDSFTFDDLLDALRFRADDSECELLVEVHCAVLKQLVSAEGKLLVNLPEIEDESEDEGDEESGKEEEEKPESPPARVTRGSLRKSEAERLKLEETPPPDPNAPTHRADELLKEYGWVDRLKARDFANGGWQVILAGVLDQLALDPRQKERCDGVLKELVPLHVLPSQESVHACYRALDMNARISALQIVTILAVGTKAMRDYLIEESERMTEIRKTKIDWQRTKRALVEELRELDEQRRAIEAEERAPEAQPPATKAAANGIKHARRDSEIEEADSSRAAPRTANDADSDATRSLGASSASVSRASASVSRVVSASDDGSAAVSEDEEEEEEEEKEEEVTTRALRQGTARKRKRDADAARRRASADALAKKKAAAVAPKTSVRLRQVVRKMERIKAEIKSWEDQVADADADLREASVQRTKLLGKDRFSNRYWWFEKNGMPFAGVPTSSTAARGYANARIWVQGPDEMERRGFLELRPDEAARYAALHGCSVVERREREEGPTRLWDAREWGYFDDAADVDRLIAWLDDRGRRERELRKDLALWKDEIVRLMARLAEHRTEVGAGAGAGSGALPTRSSARKSSGGGAGAGAGAKPQCLGWRNSKAVDVLGHLHSEQPRPRPPRSRAKKVSRPRAGADKAPAEKVPGPGPGPVLLGRSGKPLTRQGR